MRRIPQDDYKKLLPLKKIAEASSYSFGYVSILVQRKKLKARKIGNKYYSTREWFDQYIELHGRDEKKLPEAIVEELNAAPLAPLVGGENAIPLTPFIKGENSNLPSPLYKRGRETSQAVAQTNLKNQIDNLVERAIKEKLGATVESPAEFVKWENLTPEASLSRQAEQEEKVAEFFSESLDAGRAENVKSPLPPARKASLAIAGGPFIKGAEKSSLVMGAREAAADKPADQKNLVEILNSEIKDSALNGLLSGEIKFAADLVEPETKLAGEWKNNLHQEEKELKSAIKLAAKKIQNVKSPLPPFIKGARIRSSARIAALTILIGKAEIKIVKFSTSLFKAGEAIAKRAKKIKSPLPPLLKGENTKSLPALFIKGAEIKKAKKIGQSFVLRIKKLLPSILKTSAAGLAIALSAAAFVQFVPGTFKLNAERAIERSSARVFKFAAQSLELDSIKTLKGDLARALDFGSAEALKFNPARSVKFSLAEQPFINSAFDSARALKLSLTGAIASVSLPEISLPDISLPDISLPKLAIAWPKLALPKINLPKISLPAIRLAEIKPALARVLKFNSARNFQNNLSLALGSRSAEVLTGLGRIFERAYSSRRFALDQAKHIAETIIPGGYLEPLNNLKNRVLKLAGLPAQGWPTLGREKPAGMVLSGRVAGEIEIAAAPLDSSSLPNIPANPSAGGSTIPLAAVQAGQAASANARQLEILALIADKQGKIADGEYDVRFSLYNKDRTALDAYPSNADQGSRVWEETQKVTIKNGALRASLGATKDLPLLTVLAADRFYLGIRVGSDSEMTPRKKIPAPFYAFNAMNAGQLAGRTVGSKAGNIPALNSQGKNIGRLDYSLMPAEVTDFLYQATGGAINQSSGATTSLASSLLNTDFGGTGLTAYTKGDMLYYDSGKTLSRVAIGSEGQVLSIVNGVPTWANIKSTTTVLGGGGGGSAINSTSDLTEGSNLYWTDARFDSKFNTSIAAVSAIGPNSAIYMDANGNVGIGTTTLAAKFTVWGIGTTTSQLANFVNSASSSLLAILENGFVGIGTSSPTDIFSVNGPIYLANVSPSVTNNRLYANGGDLYYAGNLIGGATTGNWTSDGANVWRATGSVGIGTSSPYAKLSVAGAVVADYFYATSTTETSIFSGGLIVGNNGALTVSSAAPANSLYITSGGSVGLGTTSPWGLLSVNANGLATGTPQFVVGSSTATNFIVANNGNVGIGTSTPDNFKLEIAGDFGPEAHNTRNIGSPTRYFNTAYIKNLVTGTSGSVGYWNRSGTTLSPFTSGDSVAIYAGSANTSGSLFTVAYTGSATLDGSLIGAKIDLNDGHVIPTNQSVTGLNVILPTTTNTNLVGTTVSMNGMSLGYGVGTGINQTGTGETVYNGVNLLMPAITQTAGTLTANGALITTSPSITTAGTANGLKIAATGVGIGSLNGVLISGITGSTGLETALNIGSGWDNILTVNGSTVINGTGVIPATAGGTGMISYTAGDMIYASDASTLTKLAGGAANNGKVLVITGGVPVWGVISGSSCVNCLVNNPTAVATQTITPDNQDISSLVVRQTTYASPTQDIFQVTSADGQTRYFYVDSAGNVSTGGVSSQSITLTPTSNTAALTLVGTNVPTANLMYINSENIQGVIFNMAYGAATTTTGALTGQKIDLATNLTATDQSVTGINLIMPSVTNTVSTSNYKGLSIGLAGGVGINQNGAGATVFSGVDVTIPPLTQTAGSLTGNGLLVTMPSTITTGGAANGLKIAATGIGAGILTGINIGDITPGAGSEIALNVGTGWDYAAIFQGGNVGIGTTSPSNKLQVAADGTGPTNATMAGAQILLTGSTNPNRRLGLGYDTTNNYGWIQSAEPNFAGYTNLILNGLGGNVGIGTTSPYEKLSVAGGVVADYFYATSTTATSTFAGGLSVGNGDFNYDYSSGVTSINSLTTGPQSFDSDMGAISWIDMPVSSDSAWGSIQSYSASIAGNSLLTIYAQADGIGGIIATSTAIGIGTTTPLAMLDIFAGSTTPMTTGRTANYDAVAITNQATSSGANLIKTGLNIQSTGSWSGTAASNVGLYISSVTGGTNNYDAIFNGGGNVGIGTTSPYAKFSIATATGADGSQSTLFAIASSTATATTNLFTVLNNGNVGVGTAVPDRKLQLNESLANTSVYLHLTNAVTGSSAVDGVLLGVDTGGNTMLLNYENTDLRFSTNSLEKMRLTNTGLLGIGTTSPNNMLDIYSATKSALSFTGGTTAGQWTMGYDVANGRFSIASSTALGTLDRFVIDGNGLIGIGTTTPNSLLSLYQASSNVGLTFGDSNTTNFIFGTDYAASSSLKISAGSALGTNDLITITPAQTSFQTPASFEAAGDVSLAYDLVFNNPTASYIKSASPIYIEAGELFNSSDLTLRTFNSGNIIMDAGETGGTIIQASSTAASLTVYQNGSLGLSNGPIAAFYASSTEVMRIFATAAGLPLIGIGTTSPQGLLDLSGASNSTDLTIFDGSRALSLINTDLTANNMSGLDFRTMDANGLLTTGAKIMGVYTSHTANAVSGDLAFVTRNGGSIAERMRLTANGNLGIGTTSPYAKLSVAGLGVFDNLFASSTTATSTFAGGLDVGNGALTYDFSSGVTSIASVELGAMNFETDAGSVSWADLLLSDAAAGTVESYTASLNGSSTIMVYGLSAGSGYLQNDFPRVSIGSTTPPTSKLTIFGNGVGTGGTFEVVNDASTTLFKILDNGNIGVGTTSPYQKFSISGNLALTGGFYDSLGSAGSNFQILQSTGSATKWISTSSLFTAGIDSLPVGIAGQTLNYQGSAWQATSALTILANGFVGIGTTSPYTMLSVAGEVVADFFTATSTTATSTFAGNLVVNGTADLASSIIGPMVFDTDAGALLAASQSWIDLPLATGSGAQSYSAQIDGTNILTVYANGDGLGGYSSYGVGIGTTTPGALFSVGGNSLFGTGSASIFTLNAGIFAWSQAATTTILDNLASAWSIATSTAAGTAPIISIQTSAGNLATTTINGGLIINNGDFNYDYSSGITSINSLTTGPQSFDSDSGITNWIDMPVSSASAWGSIQSYSASIASYPILTIYSAADGVGGIIATSTAVGIGTTTPLAMLDIFAGSTTPFTTGRTANYDAVAITNQATSSTANLIKTGLNIQSTGDWNGSGAKNIGLYISSITGGAFNYDAIFNGGGNVGIGTTSPQRKLTVQSSDGLAQILLTDGLAGADYKHWGIKSSNGDFSIGQMTDALAYTPLLTIASTTSGVMATSTFATNLSILGDTYLPSAYMGALSFAPDAGLVNAINLPITSAPIAGTPEGMSFTLGDIATSSFNLYGLHSGTNAGIYNFGVGIGSTTPGAKLSIDGVMNEAMPLVLMSTTSPAYATTTAFMIDYNGKVGIGGQSGANILTVAGSSYFSGNVGIGTSTPSMKLSVWGAGANGYFGISNILQGDIFTVNSNGFIGIGTTSPYAKLSVAGEVVADIFTATSTTATSTFAGGLVANGTSILDNVEMGGLTFDTDAGAVTWMDMPFSSLAPSGTVESYTASLNGSSTLTIYGTSNGSGYLLQGPNVGIGTTSPYSKLALVDETTNLRDVFTISTSTVSGLIFKVDSYGATYADGAYSGAGADYAEYFKTGSVGLKAGEVVCVDILENSAVKRCERGADNNLMGIVSAKPSVIGNYSKEAAANPAGYAIIGMLGQVDAFVSAENGPINIGDSLTSASSTPGYAMRADGGDSTVGVALERLASGTGKIKVLISRRNKSLAVEEVEALVVERIANMKIEDRVQQMIKQSVDNLNLDPKIEKIAQEEAGKLDAVLTVNINDINGAITNLRTQTLASINDLNSQITELSSKALELSSNWAASLASSTALAENIKIDEEGKIVIGKTPSNSPLSGGGQAGVNPPDKGGAGGFNEPAVEIVNVTEINASSTQTAFVVNQAGSGQVADFRNNGVSIMNIDNSGQVKIMGSMLVDGRIMLCTGGNCSNALDSAVDATQADLGVEGKVVAGAFEGYCDTGFVWVPGSAKYGTLPGFCVMSDLASPLTRGDEGGLLGGKTPSTSPLSGGEPWTSVSQGEAQASCQSLGAGYHLIGENEWLTIAENILQVAANDADKDTAGMQLASSTQEIPLTPFIKGEETTAGAGGFVLTNDNIINNLSGATAEWTNQNVTAAGLPVVSPLIKGDEGGLWSEYSEVSDYKGLNIAPDYYLTDENNHIGRIYVGSQAGLKGFVRGLNGIYGLDLSHTPDEKSETIGFRCAK